MCYRHILNKLVELVHLDGMFRTDQIFFLFQFIALGFLGLGIIIAGAVALLPGCEVKDFIIPIMCMFMLGGCASLCGLLLALVIDNR